MHVDVIDSPERLHQLKEDWDYIYGVDPDAHFFLSWTWMSKWFEGQKSQWFVLAAREDDSPRYVAIFPLRIRTKRSMEGDFYNEIAMGGNRFADYTGFLCIPDFEQRAIPAFAKSLLKVHWARFHLEGVRTSPSRLETFLNFFRSDAFLIGLLRGVNPDGTDNHVCPFVRLPSDWDTYLQKLSANTRQKLRRLLRKIDGSDEFRITHATEHTIERDIEVLIRLWRERRAERKGDKADGREYNLCLLLKHCFASGALFLPVLWQGDRPLGALGSLIDREKRCLLFWVSGSDESFDSPSPGLVLHAHSIRQAISNGFTTYDFLRGNEPYKYTFKPEEHLIRHIVIATRNGRNLGDRLEARSLPAALRLAGEMQRAEHFEEAERGYRQILHTDPHYAPALYGLAKLEGARSDYVAAERLFRALVTTEPRHPRFWFGLAASLEAQRRFSEAADALLQGSTVTLSADRLGKNEGCGSCDAGTISRKSRGLSLKTRLAGVSRLSGRSQTFDGQSSKRSNRVGIGRPAGRRTWDRGFARECFATTRRYHSTPRWR